MIFIGIFQIVFEYKFSSMFIHNSIQRVKFGSTDMVQFYQNCIETVSENIQIM